jgi:hypothetical protein
MVDQLDMIRPWNEISRDHSSVRGSDRLKSNKTQGVQGVQAISVTRKRSIIGTRWYAEQRVCVRVNLQPRARFFAMDISVFWPIDVHSTGYCYGWTEPVLCVAGVVQTDSVGHFYISISFTLGSQVPQSLQQRKSY